VTHERLLAEQVVDSLTVRISEDTAEEFFRVDFTRGDPASDHLTTTVAPGDSFMMTLIEGAVSGEALAWRHLAHWGRDNLARPGWRSQPRFG
jgi:hypothetical protein